MAKQQIKKHIPMRMCIVTREKLPKNKLARFVFDPETHTIKFDPTGKQKGRGANIKPALEVFDKALETGAFNRAFKSKIFDKNKEEIRSELEQYIAQQELRQGQKVVTVRLKGDNISL